MYKIMEKKVAIILPNYNSEKSLKKTLKSIYNQTYKNWKLYIVDDHSNYETVKILKKIKNKKVKIFFLKKNKGAGFCRNLAIKNSKSHFLAFIDSDDVWEKNKLKSQINFMLKNNYNFTYTNYKTFSPESKKVNFISPPYKFTFEDFIKNTSIGTSTMLIKSTIVKNLRFINTKICEDYFYKCKLLKKVKLAYCFPFFLTKYQ